MGLRDRLSGAMKDAMKAKEAKRLSTVRLMLADIQKQGIAVKNENLSDDEILGVLTKMIKQREDSVATYEQGGRPELAAGEREEIAIIREFMPKQLSPEETRAAVQETIAAVGAASIKDMGKVMGALKAGYAGQMDFAKAGARAQRHGVQVGNGELVARGGGVFAVQIGAYGGGSHLPQLLAGGIGAAFGRVTVLFDLRGEGAAAGGFVFRIGQAQGAVPHGARQTGPFNGGVALGIFGLEQGAVLDPEKRIDQQRRNRVKAVVDTLGVAHAVDRAAVVIEQFQAGLVFLTVRRIQAALHEREHVV